MIEFGVLCALWLAFLVYASRKGTRHLVSPVAGVVLPLAGGIAGAVIEALPFTPITPGFTLRTVIAIVVGVFAGRFFGRIAALWARHAETHAAAMPGRPPRLVHPLIAAGMLVAGAPVIFHVITSNHAAIEEQTTPRDAQTGIARGSEEIRLEGTSDRAVLLLHGLYASPTDFGDLPQRLHAKGLTVAAPLLPGHGRMPDDLDAVWADDYVKAVRKAYDDLAAKNARVSIVGFSMGATLALVESAERKPHALVLVNPYLGHIRTPSWCPVAYDDLAGPLSRVVRRTLDKADSRGEVYCTRSLHAVRQLQSLAKRLPAGKRQYPCTPLFLLSGQDEKVPADSTKAWIAAHVDGDVNVTEYARDGHRLYRDADAGAAIDLTVKWVLAGDDR